MKPDTKKTDRFVKYRRSTGVKKHGRISSTKLTSLKNEDPEDIEDMPSHSGMREKNADWPDYTQIWVSNAMWRFLDTQVGKKWDSIYGAVKERMKNVDDIKYLVDHVVEDKNGVKYAAGPFGQLYPIDHLPWRSHRKFYIDLDGTLRKAKSKKYVPRARAKYFHIEHNEEVYLRRTAGIFKFPVSAIKTDPMIVSRPLYRNDIPKPYTSHGLLCFGGDFKLNGEPIGNVVHLADLRQTSPESAPSEALTLTVIDS